MKAIIHGSGGADTDGLTAISAHVLNGEIFYGANSDEPQTGTMTVNSILSFSVAAYSGRRVLLNGRIRMRLLENLIAE